VKRTLERELKVPEVAEREAVETSLASRDCRAPKRINLLTYSEI
jgi:hypothetical protein